MRRCLLHRVFVCWRPGRLRGLVVMFLLCQILTFDIWSYSQVSFIRGTSRFFNAVVPWCLLHLHVVCSSIVHPPLEPVSWFKDKKVPPLLITLPPIAIRRCLLIPANVLSTELRTETFFNNFQWTVGFLPKKLNKLNFDIKLIKFKQPFDLQISSHLNPWLIHRSSLLQI